MQTRIMIASAALLAMPTLSFATTCPTLSLGSTGPSVTTLQQVLYKAYKEFPTPTGYFGPVTEAALKQWQGEHGIETLGIAGPKTSAAMHIAWCTSPTSSGQANTTTPVSATTQTSSSVAGSISSPQADLIKLLLAQVAILQAKLAALIAANAGTTNVTGTVATTGGGGGGSSSTVSGGSTTGGGVSSSGGNSSSGSGSGDSGIGVVTPPINPPAGSARHPYQGGFQILIDTNQLYLSESTQLTRIAADGVWSIPQNSGDYAVKYDPNWRISDTIPDENWSAIFAYLNADTWTISESVPTDMQSLDATVNSVHRMVDAAFNYQEDGLAITTTLSDTQIAAVASHTVSQYGAVGPRVVFLARSYGDSAHVATLQRAIANPNVSGAAFEFIPGDSSSASYDPPWSLDPAYKFDAACAYVLSAHKKCYLLVAPGPHATDYLDDVQKAIGYFRSSGVLNNADTYVVIAAYGRPFLQHFISTDANDRNSVEAVINWLKSYRQTGVNSPPPPPPPVLTTLYLPRGNLDNATNCDSVFGWAQDQDAAEQALKVNFWIDTAGVTWGGQVTANQNRGDLCSAIGSCKHGFTFSVPAQFRDGNQHSIYAYAIDADGTNYAQLSGSPKTFQCSQ